MKVIPRDVIRDADEWVKVWEVDQSQSMEAMVAAAIMAERERCANIAENYNETHSQFATIMRNWNMENHPNGGVNTEIAAMIRSSK